MEAAIAAIAAVTEARAIIIGATDTRSFTFVVDIGPTCLGLPLEEIEALGLRCPPYV